MNPQKKGKKGKKEWKHLQYWSLFLKANLKLWNNDIFDKRFGINSPPLHWQLIPKQSQIYIVCLNPMPSLGTWQVPSCEWEFCNYPQLALQGSDPTSSACCFQVLLYYPWLVPALVLSFHFHLSPIPAHQIKMPGQQNKEDTQNKNISNPAV